MHPIQNKIDGYNIGEKKWLERNEKCILMNLCSSFYSLRGYPFAITSFSFLSNFSMPPGESFQPSTQPEMSTSQNVALSNSMPLSARFLRSISFATRYHKTQRMTAVTNWQHQLTNDFIWFCRSAIWRCFSLSSLASASFLTPPIEPEQIKRIKINITSVTARNRSSSNYLLFAVVRNYKIGRKSLSKIKTSQNYTKSLHNLNFVMMIMICDEQ